MPPFSFLHALSLIILALSGIMAAKPLHREHDSSRWSRDDRQTLPDPANGFVFDYHRIHESDSRLRDSFLGTTKDVSKRQENQSSGWGSWRPAGFQGARPSTTPPDRSADMWETLGEINSYLRALFDVLAAECDARALNSSGSYSNSSMSQLTQTTVSTPQTSTILLPHSTSPCSQSSSVYTIPTHSAAQANPAAPLPPTQPPRSFNPNRPDLTVVYYGQSPATSSVSLPQLCADPNIDIINLAFVSHFFFTPSGQPATYPTLNLWAVGGKCSGAANQKQTDAGATGLIDCVTSGLAGEIAQCQQQGKKIMLSLGGAQGYSNTAIANEQKANELANTLWDLFLGGTDNTVTRDIRPFGAVVLDGIDIDNEHPSSSTYLRTLLSTLRTLMSTNTPPGKKYYISAAPQCPRPDLSIPIPTLLPYIDFVAVQFYNNPSCNINNPGFRDSLLAWSNDLASAQQSGSNSNSFVDIGNGLTRSRLLIAALAGNVGAGYVSVQEYRRILAGVNEWKSGSLNLNGTLGGAVFWDGAYLELAKQNNAGSGYAEAVREIFG